MIRFTSISVLHKNNLVKWVKNKGPVVCITIFSFWWILNVFSIEDDDVDVGNNIYFCAKGKVSINFLKNNDFFFENIMAFDAIKSKLNVFAWFGGSIVSIVS